FPWRGVSFELRATRRVSLPCGFPFAPPNPRRRTKLDAPDYRYHDPYRFGTSPRLPYAKVQPRTNHHPRRLPGRRSLGPMGWDDEPPMVEVELIGLLHCFPRTWPLWQGRS